MLRINEYFSLIYVDSQSEVQQDNLTLFHTFSAKPRMVELNKYRLLGISM